MKALLIVLAISAQATGLHAQDSSFRLAHHIRSTDILLGIHWQGDGRESAKNEKMYRYFEIGLAKSSHYSGICASGSGTVCVSEEMHFGKDKNIFGTKVGAWFHYLIDLGMAMVYYTDFKRGNFKIRPEIGCGLGPMRAVVGFNIPTINNKAFTELAHHNMQLSIQFTLGIKQKILK